MNLSLPLLLANMVATLFLVGLIWMVQIVHYPLFDDVGDQNYVRYHQRHQVNITYIVGPAMLVELATAILMVWCPMEGISKWLTYSGLALVVLIWMSTAFIQVPCHQRLALGFDQNIHEWLVHSNWIRTVLWTARGFVVVWMLILIKSNGTVVGGNLMFLAVFYSISLWVF